MRGIEPKQHYDVVIIGGGVSGLTSAALFSKAGISCCVIEMDNRPGGYLAGFRRHDFRFDSAIHWLNNCGPNGLVTKIFKIIGDDSPKCEDQKNIRRFVSDEFDYLVTNNPDELKEQWLKEFPHEKKGIIRFFRDAKRIGKSFDSYANLSRTMNSMSWYEYPIHGLKMLRFALPFIPHIRFTGEKMKKGLSRYFTDEKLHRVFCSEPDVLSCLIPISWAYIKDFQLPPEGGSQSFPEWLTHTIETMGGEIFFKSKVTEVIVQDNVAKGVRLEHRGTTHTISSKYVVAACDAETLFEKMLPKESIPAKMKDGLKGAPLYASALTVALGIDCPAEELGLGEEIVFLADPTVPKEDLGKGDPYLSGIHILASTVRDKSLSLPEHGTITLFIPAWMDNNDYWGCVADENGTYSRGDEYQKLKDKYADILIDRVEKGLVPNLRKHILYCDVATPITHYRYTGNKNGTMMAQKPGKENYQGKVASYITPVKNLYLSGHWADLGGGIPIAIKSSINTTLLVLQKEDKKRFKLLANYMDGKIGVAELRASDLLIPYDNSWVKDPTPAQKKVKRREESATTE
ncbi:phytoene desaturase family protein [Fluviicola taffensis]|uniref:FAD dependent oxidoreductase n=1 Tax=Fluviicola taffensis (strain DSM 16823 / NCIMB 13979 / RW262) TaxID=755732 RepID=F2ID82_FLUTR|nr:NAD(P)/FAD-dependent oxidoreductase [Fluviicola taffensis]AEA45497.1 FAD dependent oxidoreductase [Fluviicola taffensis DSM 16823]